MPALTLGLDLGTTRCKAVAVDDAGRVVATGSGDYPLHTPQPGWAEQSAEEVWQGAVTALKGVLARVPAGHLTALGLSGAMHSLLLVDGAGQPLAPAPTWADQRAAPQVEALAAHVDAHALYQRTGCRLNALYHPAKLQWWHTQAPQIAARAARFVALKDWVLWRLTGEWVTDHSLASTTGLLDLHRLTWDPEALLLAEAPAGRLPRLASPAEIGGHLTAEAAALTGLPVGLPIAPGASDGAAANLGAGAARTGQTVITVGTSGAVRRLAAQPYLDPAQRTWCYVSTAGHWFAGGAINNGGLALQWARENFYSEETGEAGYERLLREAAAVAPGADGLRVLPYFAGERSPHWNPLARAHFAGLTLTHTRAHLARAILESVAFCLADIWQALAGLPAAPPGAPEARLTGAIATNPLWAQMLADVLGVRLLADEAADASAVGAALLARLAVGQPLANGMADESTDTVYAPDAGRHAQYAQYHIEFQALYRRLYA
jgi:gluconokinase